MKVLILSCSTGGGHNSAAQAVQKILESKNVETEIVDPIRFSSEKTKDFISDLYNNIIKNSPKFFGFIYKIGAAYEATSLPSPVYHANASYAQALNDYIVENGFDCVLCSHLYAMESMTAVRKKFNADIPCYGIITDYTFIPFTAETELDGYFIPHAELAQEGIRKGFPEEKLYPCGIPVNPQFGETLSKTAAREKLGLPQDKKILLLMFGSVGCGKINKLCDKIIKKTPDDYRAYVIVGNNEKLKKKLDKRYAKTERITTVGYCTDVPLYMKAADAVISKAGGLSSTEAAVAGVPLIHLKSIPGCETKNAEFFERHGMSFATKKANQAVQFAKTLLEDETEAEKMLAAQRETVNADAAKDIVDTLLTLLKP